VAVSMYEVLVVDETAKPEEIKAAYRRTTRWWHPDACSGGADRFMAVWESYEVLSDRKRRRAYTSSSATAAAAPPATEWRCGARGSWTGRRSSSGYSGAQRSAVAAPLGKRGAAGCIVRRRSSPGSVVVGGC
jgi:DnaJ-class molecular chaperone